MTNPYYAGDAGGQPRLFIPTMGQIQDPATQTAMQTILQWANRLLLGGTGGLMLTGFGWYKTAGASLGSFFNLSLQSPFQARAIIHWVGADGFTNSFTYLQGDGFTFHAPANSLTFFVANVYLEDNGDPAQTVGLLANAPHDFIYSATDLRAGTGGSPAFASPSIMGLWDSFQSPSPTWTMFLSVISSLNLPGFLSIPSSSPGVVLGSLFLVSLSTSV